MLHQHGKQLPEQWSYLSMQKGLDSVSRTRPHKMGIYTATLRNVTTDILALRYPLFIFEMVPGLRLLTELRQTPSTCIAKVKAALNTGPGDIPPLPQMSELLHGMLEVGTLLGQDYIACTYTDQVSMSPLKLQKVCSSCGHAASCYLLPQPCRQGIKLGPYVLFLVLLLAC